MEGDEAHRIRTIYGERDRTPSWAAKFDQNIPGNAWLVHEHLARLRRMLTDRLERPLPECRVLDVGCGGGSLLGWFHELGVPTENLFGIDLLPNRIKIARETYPTFTFVEGNAEHLEFPNDSFDLVPIFTVFSSILDPVMAGNVARSVSRVLTRRGAVVWYDMRYPNPWNSHLKAMTKSRIQKLFPSFRLELEPISLLPPVARRLGRLTDQLYPLLASVPFLRSHYTGMLRPCRGGRSISA